MVFPNTGFTISTIDIGNQLESQGVQWVGSIMSILVFIMWLFVICSHIFAVVTRKIMMHGQDEDVGEEKLA
jgi:tellurite resistance protein TehA-like permease